MTTNLSLEQMIVELEKAKQRDLNIGITYSIATTVDFLDVTIENENGQLKTTVFHKPAAEPCILPFSSDHPRSNHRNIIYGGLVRAARYSSNVQDFDGERLKFELTLLTSGYPLAFIEFHFRRFFYANQVMSVWKFLDAISYQRLHLRLLNQPTRQEKKRRSLSPSINEIADYLPKKKTWNREKLIVHYHFESGPMAQYRQEFRRLWQRYYVHDQSRVKDVRLIVGTRTNTPLEHRLVKKKPVQAFLKNE